MILNSWRGAIISACLALVCAPAAAQPLQGASPVANIRLPSGPFASWPSASKVTGVEAVTTSCLMAGGRNVANYAGPKDAAREEAAGFYFSCMAKYLPADWPGQADARAGARAHLAAAHGLDPTLPLSGDAMK